MLAIHSAAWKAGGRNANSWQTTLRVRGYALGVRHQLASGTDQLGDVHAISAETGRTLWIHEQRAATMSLVATGGGR